MRVLQSDIYHQLDDTELEECKALIAGAVTIRATNKQPLGAP